MARTTCGLSRNQTSKVLCNKATIDQTDAITAIAIIPHTIVFRAFSLSASDDAVKCRAIPYMKYIFRKVLSQIQVLSVWKLYFTVWILSLYYFLKHHFPMFTHICKQTIFKRHKLLKYSKSATELLLWGWSRVARRSYSFIADVWTNTCLKLKFRN